jgi:hypothetical protein
MVAHSRTQWSRHIDQILRSNRYNRIGEGLAGAPLEEALVEIAADLMHICKRENLRWEQVLQKAGSLYEREERRRAVEMAEAPMGS